MLKAFTEYVAAIYADMISRISGIGSIILLIIALVTKISEAGQARYWLSAAFICYMVASFRVWYESRPRLIIEVQDVLLDTNYGGMLFQANRPLPQFVTLKLFLSNTLQADNSIKSYELVVNTYGHRVFGQSAETEGLVLSGTGQSYSDLNESKMSVLKQGAPIEGWLRFNMGAEQNLKGQEFVLTVVDAYNVSHKVKGRIPLDFSDGLIRGGDTRR